MSEKRSGFTGKIGFVLAAAGSAVGLGNIWRFPYLAAKYGGGVFLLCYVLIAVTFGFVLMVGEICIGRKTGLSGVSAFEKLNKKFSVAGYLCAIIPMMILPYYSVIGGWVTKYLVTFVSGGGRDTAADGFFGTYIGGKVEPVLWFILFIAATSVIVLLGVEKGIEKVSKLLMPVLVVLSIFIAVYTLFLPGAWEGVKYYVLPDFSRFSITTVVAAMGQLFYSMSLAMGIMITYGSYMKKEVNVESSVRQISLFDTGVAFFAGLMIVPAVFVFSGGDQSVLNKGPGLMFVTLPKVFDSMPLGDIFGAVFFVLVLLAALTSSISLMETVVSILQDKLKWSRRVTCIAVFIWCAVLGVIVSWGFGPLSDIKPLGMDDLLTFFDFVSNSVLMPILAFITCIFIGFIIKPKAILDEAEEGGQTFKSKKLFTVVIKYIAPVCILLILISSVLDGFGIIKI